MRRKLEVKMRLPLISIVSLTEDEDSAIALVDEARDAHDRVSHLRRSRADGEDHFVAEIGTYQQRVARFMARAMLGHSGSSKMTFAVPQVDHEAGDRRGLALVNGLFSFERKCDGADNDRSRELLTQVRKMSIVWDDGYKSLSTRHGYRISGDGLLGVHPALLRFTLSNYVRAVLYTHETILNHNQELVDVVRFAFVTCQRVAASDANDDDFYELSAKSFERPRDFGFDPRERLFQGWDELVEEAVLQLREYNYQQYGNTQRSA